MLACRLATILPPFAFPEGLEVTKLYSITGLLPADCRDRKAQEKRSELRNP
jgi:predicted ATPase with chaperone activity